MRTSSLSRVLCSSFLAAGIIMVLAGTALAQTFNEPSGTAPGSRSATFLDTSANTQRKLGTLIIGDNTGDKFCLNATNSSSATNCIASWSSLGSSLPGNYVRIHSTVVTGTPSDPNSYDPYYQIGYFRIKGNGTSAADSIASTVNLTYAGASAAVYGSDDGDFTNYAGYFSGQIVVANHYKLNAGDPTIPGQICLNGTNAYNPTGPTPRYGCISQWTDITGTTVLPYIQLQTANPPVIQTGSAQISKAWQIGSAVAGEAISGVGTAMCGDGLCSSEIGETSGSCAADCSNFTGFGNITTDPCLDLGQCDSGVLISPAQSE